MTDQDSSVELLALWERGWFEPRVERAFWKQLKSAFAVDRLMFVPRLSGIGEEFDDIPQALETTDARPVFLVPWNGVPLSEYVHPDHAVYVLGNAQNGNERWTHFGDKVSIVTPNPTDLFGHDAASIVLYDRMVKGSRRGN